MFDNTFSNIVTYAWTAHASFDEEPFNEVDSLVLSALAYLHYPEELLPKETTKEHYLREFYKSEYFDFMFHEIWTVDIMKELFFAVVASPRYRDLKMQYHQTELEHKIGKQFSAITWRVTKDLYYIAFRGTDWTLTGWEEDFKMSLEKPVPAQLLAVQYLNRVAKGKKRLIVGGHSKGGNLAVYASALCNKKMQDKIEVVYNHDGPGFSKSFFEAEGYFRIRNRIQKTCPSFSIFGMLFEEETEPKTVHCREKGIMQHNPVNWEVQGYSLVPYSHSSRRATHLNNKISNWLEDIPVEDREVFINTVFQLLEDTGVHSFQEIGEHPKKYLPLLYKEIKGLDKDVHRFMIELIKQLIHASDD